MKTSHRRSTKASRDDAKKPTGDARATRRGRGVRGATLKATKASVDAQRALAAREDSVRRHEHTLPLREGALRARETSAQTRADVERLIGQMREANERLIVSAVQAQNRSDEAHLEAVQARAELDDLMSRLDR